MAAELKQLRRDVEALAKKFRDVGQADLAEQLGVDGQSLGVKAKIAATRGWNTFGTPNIISKAEIESPAELDRQLRHSLSPFIKEYQSQVPTPELVNTTWQGIWREIGKRVRYEYKFLNVTAPQKN